MAAVEKFIQRLSPEVLTPTMLGQRLFAAFEGYDTDRLPPEQVQFLLRNYLLYNENTRGYPVYVVSSPKPNERILPWKHMPIVERFENPATTNKHTPHAPHIIPSFLHNASEIITITDIHHTSTTQENERDIVISHNGSDITLYWYFKGQDPIQLQHMTDLTDVSSNPLWQQPEGDGATIQLWKLLPTKNTYQLQTAVQLNKISLPEFVRVMGASPEDLQQIEAAAQARG